MKRIGVEKQVREVDRLVEVGGRIGKPGAPLQPGDLLRVDEAGMHDWDTARALLTIADETGARVALVDGRHQFPAVGRGGVLDHAVTWAHPTAVGSMETAHRFTEPDYAVLSLRMRNGDDAARVFDEPRSIANRKPGDKPASCFVV